MQLTTDGHRAYLHAVESALGADIDYAMLHKIYASPALAEDQRKTAAASHAGAPLVPSCGTAQPSGVEWPAGEIEARLHPNDTQRASLAALQDAGAKAAEMLKAACRTDDAMTPPARLTAIGMRLDTMLQAVKSVRTALENFYATLSDEQKAQFEAIGPRRSA